VLIRAESTDGRRTEFLAYLFVFVFARRVYRAPRNRNVFFFRAVDSAQEEQIIGLWVRNRFDKKGVFFFAR